MGGKIASEKSETPTPKITFYFQLHDSSKHSWSYKTVLASALLSSTCHLIDPSLVGKSGKSNFAWISIRNSGNSWPVALPVGERRTPAKLWTGNRIRSGLMVGRSWSLGSSCRCLVDSACFNNTHDQFIAPSPIAPPHFLNLLSLQYTDQATTYTFN